MSFDVFNSILLAYVPLWKICAQKDGWVRDEFCECDDLELEIAAIMIMTHGLMNLMLPIAFEMSIL